MNRDAEAINNILAWLFQDPTLTSNAISGDQADSDVGSNGSDVTDLNTNTLNSSTAEEKTMNTTGLSRPHSDSSSDMSLETLSPFHVGELPAVQDRFHALLKRRLQAEIARKPPVFPWESDAINYDAESEDLVVAELVPMKAWVRQIQERLPVPMSDELLVGLLQQCQSLVHSSLQRGSQLVRAVESLFPDEPQTLNYLAGLVLTSPARSPELQEVSGYPAHYESATPLQQMALSLLAAQEIMDNLTFVLSGESPNVERQIQTDYGTLVVNTLLNPLAQSLKVEIQMPCAGQLQLSSSDGHSVAHRDQPGVLSAELFDITPDRDYFLEVQLEADDSVCLKFALQITS